LAEDFDSELMGAFTDDGTTEQSSPEETEEAQHTVGDVGVIDLDTSQEPQAEDDLRSYLERTKAANPDQAAVIDRIHRELEGAWTPKLQQAAELRKQYDGITPELAGWVRQLDQLAASSPAEAAAALMAEAQRLQGLQQAAAPVEEPDFATDYDREVWHEVQELKQLKQTILAERNEAIVDRQLADVGKKLGLEIPFEEKDRVVREMVKDGAPASMAGRYWKDLYFDKALQRARDEAAGVVTRKAGMAPPPSVTANRAGQGAPPAPASFDEAIQQEFRSRNLL
jgi:hypothetical protein